MVSYSSRGIKRIIDLNSLRRNPVEGITECIRFGDYSSADAKAGKFGLDEPTVKIIAAQAIEKIAICAAQSHT